MRIGIFFGGKSREREISFAGGRTVYDLLDKSLFTPVPIFVDSLGNFIELDWQYLYKGSIRDFYPPVSSLQTTKLPFQVYIESLNLPEEDIDKAIAQVGKKRSIAEIKTLIDFAFLALHGPFGEDGSLQGLFEFYNIPYSGSGILPSAIGIDKRVQKELMQSMNLQVAKAIYVTRKKWFDSQENRKDLFTEAQQNFNLPVVIKSSTQGSSIGISILRNWDFVTFESQINESFFQKTIFAADWKKLTAEEEKRRFVQQVSDIYEGYGIPFLINNKTWVYHPQQLFDFLDDHFNQNNEPVTLESYQGERAVLIEEFIKGKEFSCIVVEGEHGEAIALPPTEIIKSTDIFDYRSKYLPGISRKVTPIELPEEIVNHISAACEELYKNLHFNVYARIDGLITADGKIYLNDPNTTSGMLPSSFFFHQAAEIGVSPSQFLTYIIFKSFENRIASSPNPHQVIQSFKTLQNSLTYNAQHNAGKQKVGVILGGISTERHISVESGRNVYEKLSSSGKYDASPVFLTGKDGEIEFYTLPLNLLLKDNADDIADKARHFHISPITEKIIEKARYITEKFASSNYNFYPKKVTLDELQQTVDSIFIALHGRPGEDGTLQKLLEARGMPYNGSSSDSSSVTINKFITNEKLRENGFLIPQHILVTRQKWQANKTAILAEIEKYLQFPCIAKPADDGCSSAVKKINNRAEFEAFAEGMFRTQEALDKDILRILDLKASEEFPQKDFFVVEELVSPKGAKHFLEITGGMLTRKNGQNEVTYEIFEPSEALAQKGILSLEEKFLAGEGQNITPARFSAFTEENSMISATVRNTLMEAAKVLNIEGYCRIDAFVRIYDARHVEVIFIEVNSLPGLTPATCIFHQAALNGYKPFDFLDQIIQYGISKVQGIEENN